jgi:hypothetical protein
VSPISEIAPLQIQAMLVELKPRVMQCQRGSSATTQRRDGVYVQLNGKLSQTKVIAPAVIGQYQQKSVRHKIVRGLQQQKPDENRLMLIMVLTCLG